MNIRQIRDLALKILGIYYLSSAIVRAPQFLSIFSSVNQSAEMAEQGLAISLAVLLPLAFWLVIGLLLTFRTGLVAAMLWPSRDEPENGAFAWPSLRFWIVLIGFFFLIRATGGAVAQVWTLAVRGDIRGSFMNYKFLPEFVTFMLSIACICKARAIEAWLKAKIGEDSQQPSGG